MRWRWRVRLNRGRGVSLLAPAASRLEPPLRLPSLSLERPPPPLNRHFEKIIPPPPSSLFAHQQTPDAPPRMDGVLCAPTTTMRPVYLCSPTSITVTAAGGGGGWVVQLRQSKPPWAACFALPPITGCSHCCKLSQESSQPRGNQPILLLHPALCSREGAAASLPPN